LFIELTEILVCPACRTEGAEEYAQGLVAVVQGRSERQVVEGWLGCPLCEARYPIRGGVVHLSDDEPEAVSSAIEAERALQAAALLGAHEAAGYLVLGRGLDAIAEPLSRLAPGCEVVAVGCLDVVPAPGETSGRVSRLHGTVDEALPFRSGSIAGIALHRPDRSVLMEALRVLRPAGRLVAFEPGRLPPTGESRSGLAAVEGIEGLQVVAKKEHVLVAVRT
jgi:uncharacterized protein YbaR (Trm112 family)